MLIFFLIGLFGLLIGSFLNVVIHRVPLRESIIFPNSHCPHCSHLLRFWENIPVLSWIALRGKCSQCHHSISIRYPLIEILTGLLSAFVSCRWGLHWSLIPALILTWVLLALTFIDFETQLLPDKITKPFMVIGLLFNTSAFWFTGFALTTPVDALIGWMVGYGCLWLLDRLYLKIKGVHGVGGGDLKMLGLIGAWLGWQSMLMTLLIAAIAGGIVGLSFLLNGENKKTAIPFGPYLALGAWAMLMYPNFIFHAYWHFLVF